MAAQRSRKRRGEGGLFALSVVGAIVMVNVAAARVHGRFDLTEGRLYTLSAASRDLVRALPDRLTVKAYLPADLPPELTPRARYLRDLLEEYRTASGDKLRVELDDRNDVKTEEEATRCGIDPTAFQLRRGQKLEAGRAIVGLCVWYDGRSRALTAPGSLGEMEYEISATIKRVAHKPRKLAFSTGHGERDLGDGYSFVKLGLGGEHELVTLNPSAGIGDDVDLLVVAGPRRPFDDPGTRAIESFLARGKGVVFLLDGMLPAPGDGGAGEIPGVAVDTGLGPLLERHGFRIRGDLVFDRQNAPGPVPGRQGALFANRPAFVEVTRASLAPTPVPPLVEGIPALVFPFPSSIDLVGPLAGGPPPGAVLWPLARASSASWRLPVAPSGADRGLPTLAYAYRGPAGGPARQVRMVVFGGSGFAADEVMQLVRSFPIYAGNAELLFRAVDWLLEDEALAPLRANVQRARPLATGSDEHAAAFTWGNAVGVPLAFCAAGMLRWRLRRAGGRRSRFDTDGGGGR
jgi:ABC-type uncharacterized transport system involved in gliding motility auxiliary subunit